MCQCRRGLRRGAANCPEYSDLENMSSFNNLAAISSPNRPLCPQLPSEVKSDLTLGWAHTQAADPACYECLPHETLCVLNSPVKIGLYDAFFHARAGVASLST